MKPVQHLLQRGIPGLCVLMGLILSIACPAAVAEDKSRKTENVILITFDGLRWQEVFGGADESLFNQNEGGVRNFKAINSKYWRESAHERRMILLPFFWKTVATQGQVFGDPEHNSVARVTNGLNFSYPGYNEMLTGAADPLVNSNAKRNNQNITVLEWLNRRERFRGRVAAFCTWDVFPFIINTERSGVYVNAGHEPFRHGTDLRELELLNKVERETPYIWEGERFDSFTFHGAMAYLKDQKPPVFYISFGETDDWAHERRYDLYLDAALRLDGYVQQLWETLQTMPEYAGKTSIVITTDHGRGDTGKDWTSHNKDIPVADRIWMAVLGPDTPAEGLRKDIRVTQGQTAATVAALLGEDYNAAAPKAAEVLPGVINVGKK